MKLEIFDKPVSQDKVVNLRLSKNSSGSNVILEAVDQEGKLITQILEINSGSGWGNDADRFITHRWFHRATDKTNCEGGRSQNWAAPLKRVIANAD